MSEIDTTRKTRNGLLIQADDLEVGDCICVHSLKSGKTLPYFHGFPGTAYKVKAINFPFVVLHQAGAHRRERVVTLDLRFLNIMTVDETFVKAQADDDEPDQPDGREADQPESRSCQF